MRHLYAMIVLALGVTVNAISAEVGVTDTKIIVGQVAPLTGNNKDLGLQYVAGARAYFDWINETGGVYGRKIVVILEDDKYDPKLTLEQTKKLIEKDHVFSLFGYVGTPTSNAAMPYFIAKGVPFFAPFTGATSLREPVNRLIFNIRASYCDEVSRIVDHMGAPVAQKAAVIFQNDGYGQTVLDCAKAALARVNASPIVVAPIERNSLKIDSAVAAVAAAKPDAVIIAGAYKPTALLITKLKASTTIPRYYNVSFVGVTALANELEGKGRGVIVTQVTPSPEMDLSDSGRRYKEALGDQYLSSTAYEGWLAAKAFVIGLKRVKGPLTRESFIEALEQSEIDLGQIHLRYTPYNHNGSRFVDEAMISIGKRILR